MDSNALFAWLFYLAGAVVVFLWSKIHDITRYSQTGYDTPYRLSMVLDPLEKNL